MFAKHWITLIGICRFYYSITHTSFGTTVQVQSSCVVHECPKPEHLMKELLLFAMFREINDRAGRSGQIFFQLYLVVPFFTMLTAIFLWPSEILPVLTPNGSYIGAGSPYLKSGFKIFRWL